jgi:hypothetical protein
MTGSGQRAGGLAGEGREEIELLLAGNQIEERRLEVS